MPGPRPKPSSSLQLRGTQKATRVRKNKVRSPGEPRMPRELSAPAKKVWKRVVPHLAKVVHLSEGDRDELAAYCEATALASRLQREAATAPAVIESGQAGCRVKNPIFTALDSASARASRLADKFGLSPAARTGIEIKSVENQTDKKQFFAA